MKANPGAINSGSQIFDQIVTVLMSTSMFTAGVLGFFLDNTIPGKITQQKIKKKILLMKRFPKKELTKKED
jgi:nucleobase transporter 1/2